MSYTPPRYHTEEIIQLYAQGWGYKKIAKKIGCDYTSIGLLLKRNGIKTREGGGQAKHEIDDDFFSVINTEAKAYWLGFILADGAIYETGHVLIGLARVDHIHLEKLLKSVQSTSSIKQYTKKRGTQMSTARLFSKKMVSDLNALGLRPRKTFTDHSQLIDAIPKDLARHFWRGVIDGDGSVYECANGRCGINLTGTETTCQKFEEFVAGLGLRKMGWNTRKSSYCVTIARKKDLIALLEAYGNSNVYLERKQAKYKEIVRIGGRRTNKDR